MEPSIAAAEVIGGNIDLVNEILLRLPIKPLMRFKCVSKQWLSLISNPNFCHSHTLHHHHIFPSSLLLNPYPGRLDQPHVFPIIPITGSNSDPFLVSNFDFLNVPEMQLSIRHSCNGLLLVEEIRRRRRPDEQQCYFVCNPITKQFVALGFQTLSPGTTIHSIFLAFDPIRSSSHFKVISIRRKVTMSHDLEDDFQIFMYSSETGRWNDLGICFTALPYLRLHTFSGIYFNCGIYWYNDEAEKSLYFDVENQCLKTFPMPSNIANYDVAYFGESGGHLHMIMNEVDDNELDYSPELVFDILELKEDYSGWSVRFHVDLTPMVVAFPQWNLNLEEIAQSLYVSCIVRQQKEEESLLVFFLNGTIMSYNLVNYTFKELISFHPFLESNAAYIKQVFQYAENLSWVGASTDY